MVGDHEALPRNFFSERGMYLVWDEVDGIQSGVATSVVPVLVHVGGRHTALDIAKGLPTEEFIASAVAAGSAGPKVEDKPQEATVEVEVPAILATSQESISGGSGQ